MKNIFYAIGIAILLIGASTISLGADSQPEIKLKEEGETTTFRFAVVTFAVTNPTEFEYEHVIGGKILKNSVLKNVTLSGELMSGYIINVLAMVFLRKEWIPVKGVNVTVEIGKFIGQIFEGTYEGKPYIGLSGSKCGFGFDVKATVHELPS